MFLLKSKFVSNITHKNSLYKDNGYLPIQIF